MRRNKFDLSGKTAIVTGGGSGIGRAIAETLAAQGAYTIVIDINEETGQSVASKIEETGGKAHSYGCDVSDSHQVKQVFSKALGDRSLDILVNNAGVAHIGNVLNTSVEDFDSVISVNIKGVFYTLQAGVEAMRAKGGAIVNLSSVAAHVGVADRFAYSTSKGAVHAMTLSVAKDCIGYGIRCNSISPGRVHTPFVDGFLAKNYPGKEQEMYEKLSKTQPIGRMGKPDEMGSLVLYLCSDESSFITGSDFCIDGGFVTLNT